MKYVTIEQLVPDPDQPRQSFDPKALDLLVESIKEHGILQPLMVEEIEKGKYLLVDGERRYRASKRLKLKEIPVEVMPKMGAKERMVARFQIQEQHHSWNHFDKARAIYFFAKSEGLNVDQISEMLGIDRSQVYRWFEILKLSKRSQETAINRRIPFSYLDKVLLCAKRFSNIVDMPVEEIENILLDKIESRAVVGQENLTALAKILNVEGSEDKKIKFLKNKNYTVSNLLDETPEGNSFKVDSFVRSCNWLKTKANRLLKMKDYSELTNGQEKVLQGLVDTINKFI